MKGLFAGAALVLLCASARAQSIPVVDDSNLPRFEVVSVKPGDPNAFSRGMGFRPGAFFVKASALFNALMIAFGLRVQQTMPLPDFFMREPFTIEARAAAGTPQTDLP